MSGFGGYSPWTYSLGQTESSGKCPVSAEQGERNVRTSIEEYCPRGRRSSERIYLGGHV